MSVGAFVDQAINPLPKQPTFFRNHNRPEAKRTAEQMLRRIDAKVDTFLALDESARDLAPLIPNKVKLSQVKSDEVAGVYFSGELSGEASIDKDGRQAYLELKNKAGDEPKAWYSVETFEDGSQQYTESYLGTRSTSVFLDPNGNIVQMSDYSTSDNLANDLDMHEGVSTVRHSTWSVE